MEELLRRVEAAGKPSNERCIAEELVREGVASALVDLVDGGTQGSVGEEAPAALAALVRLLAGHEAACAVFGATSQFQRLLSLVLMELNSLTSCDGLSSAMTLSALMAGYGSVMNVLAASPEAQAVASSNRDLLCLVKRLLVCTDGGGSDALGRMGVEMLCQLTMTKSRAVVSSDARKLVGSRCAVCLEDFELDTSGSALQELWRCAMCSQALHSSCAETWLSRTRRCPLCRMWAPPQEVNDLMMCDQLLQFLESDRVSTDAPLAFITSLLLVNLSSAKQYGPPVDILRSRGFFSDLAAAAEAAACGSDWPEGSKCFPLPWKLAITMQRLVSVGCVADLEPLVKPLVISFMQSSDDDTHAWCSSALAKYVSAGGNYALVENALESYQESHGTHDDWLLAQQLRQMIQETEL